ncbi:hypothetical protein ERO13_A03G135305v2 [Gossypium hirsutum]|uniref:Uncharacterized protein n=1 Tax=Gossypium hirsutum TaxID=3635 RepID=A0A1U8HIZ0_GOSHI|nr:uncharacterized protein LOC107886542 [Gossypium hirsutum]KAG4208488.1 hypothetical protein ERO13_A03G135305v2 [Gossypium hirsutum]
MPKNCAAFCGLVRHGNQDSGSKKDARGSPMSVDFSQSRDISVRIVHAGGQEELYQNAVPVSHLMNKYPGMCIARPEVFTNPDESLLWPEDSLLPGQKYYIIPSSTVEKLKYRHRKKLKFKQAAEGREDMSDARITWIYLEKTWRNLLILHKNSMLPSLPRYLKFQRRGCRNIHCEGVEG